jgi:hypothetical protein
MRKGDWVEAKIVRIEDSDEGTSFIVSPIGNGGNFTGTERKVAGEEIKPNAWLKVIKTIIKTLTKKGANAFFGDPVDVTQYKDYPRKIRNPITLGSIQVETHPWRLFLSLSALSCHAMPLLLEY